MEEPHLEFQRFCMAHQEAVTAKEVLERINRVGGYIQRLLRAYQLATHQIGELRKERDLLKLECHLLTVELEKSRRKESHGYNFNTTSPQCQEKQPPSEDRGGE
jgi:hypothetical protein